ncbi:MAG: RIP metalloprotease RseP [Candidatus Omnitrophica bacterium]|nr:RIP metalloprotease RseP [Candidatus Omnitrophota bacterium]
MLSLIVFLFVLGLLVIVHESGHFMAAKKVGIKVEKFSLGFGPAIISKKKGDTEYSLCAVLLGGYVKLAGDNPEEYKGTKDEYLSKTPWQRAQVVFCGPLLNFILGFLLFWLIFFTGYPALTARVGSLIDGFGAKEAGIKAQDNIIAVGGKRIVLWEELQEEIQGKKQGDTLDFLISRDGKELKVKVKIKEKEFTDILGQKRSVGLAGIAPSDEFIRIRHGFLESFSLGLTKTYDLTVITYRALWRIVTGKLSMRESVSGPLGIFYVTSKVAALGVTAVLHLMAALSISLAIFNLLPLPVLDGGHLFLLAIEKIRRKRLSLRTERLITQAGMALILSLAVLATYNDIMRIFGDKLLKWFR